MDEILTSPIFTFLKENYLKSKQKVLFALEGASGAAKTWGIIDFICEYCRINAYENKRISIGRREYSDCMDTIGFDFFKRLKEIGWFDDKNMIKANPENGYHTSYYLLGNQIDFMGWNSKGQVSKRQDILVCNEILENDEEDFKNRNQRTNEIILFDWNPKVTMHWVYDKLLTRPDCIYRLCLMDDNPFLPEGQRQELLKYEPTPENITNGTADEYMYNVYVLGKRGDPKGVIFKNIKWINQFPENIHYDYGMDFGFTVDPTTIVKSSEDATNIWMECLCYEPIETPQEIHEYAKVKGINIKLPTTADSSDKYTGENKGTVEMVKGLAKLGWNIFKVEKTQSVMFWLLSMKKKKIHIVKNEFYQKIKIEAENYKMREINGIAINQPIDKYNHFWDGARYRHMSFNQPKSNLINKDSLEKIFQNK